MTKNEPIRRNLLKYLIKWKNRARKPLIIRGARQVGKTSLVRAFGQSEFKSFIEINLDRTEHQQLFKGGPSSKNFLESAEALFNTKIIAGKTLLFIDEIQNSEEALHLLRYLYEDFPDLHVIAAGSLLDVILKREKFSVPVGRVEYCYLHPVSFDEFLEAQGKSILLNKLRSISLTDTLPAATHEQLLGSFKEYSLIGGMPEVVAAYCNGASYLDLKIIYESLYTGFMDDVAKYASPSQAVYIKHVLFHAPTHAGMQISYANFGDSKYLSREMSMAFSALEMAMLLLPVRSSRSLALPLVTTQKKSPKLLFLDSGLMNYRLNGPSPAELSTNLENIFKGQLSEQVAGQALVSLQQTNKPEVHYWYRDKVGSSAELDYLLNHNGELIGVEVKSGSSKMLRSLHLFVDESGAKRAVRICSDSLSVEKVKTSKGKVFDLLSIPFYLVWRINELLE